MVNRIILGTVALTAAVFVLPLLTSVAQGSKEPQWICSTTIRVEPAKVHEVELRLRKLKREFEQRGAPWFVTLETFAGNTGEFTVMTPLDKFGDLDTSTKSSQQPPTFDSFRGSTSQTREFSTPQRNLEIKVQGSSAGDYWVETNIQVFPGKLNEYLNWLENDYRPALEKAGVKRFVVLRPIFGASAGEVVTIRMLNSLAEIDNGSVLNKVMSDQAAREMNAKSVLLSSSSATRIVHLRADLSYLKEW